jgi:hypothetical protein
MQRRVAAVLIAVIVIAVGAIAAVLLLRDDGGGVNETLAAFSNRGRPIEMALPERLGPNVKPTGEVLLIAERKGLRFLRLPRVDGSSCWATADRRFGDWGLTEFACETDFTRFPDPRRPVLTVGRLGVSPDPELRLIDYTTFAGFAADGVRRVAVIDEHDRVVPVAEVVRNVFYAPTPPTRVKAIAALDAAGMVVWRGGGLPAPAE